MADRIVFAFDRKTARSKDADGRMRVKDCVLSTAEINPYRGNEIPGYTRLGLDANKVYELFRDPEELKRAAPTFEGVPLMIKHTAQTAEDPKKEYIGGSVHSITFDGKHLRGDLLVMDGYAIDLIESDTLSDLSCGYRYDPVMRAGEIDGSKYDGVMRNIQGNHVALVDDGRANGAHVADHALFNPQAPDPSMQGDSNMALPEQNAPAAPAPAAGQNDQVNMASIGQALKHIAGLLEQLYAAQGGGAAGGDTSAAPAPQAGGEEMEQTADTAGADNEPLEGAEDFNLELGAQHAGAAAGEAQDGDLNVGQENPDLPTSNQEGTGARGNPTPTGAMDSRNVRAMVAKAVQDGVKQERARAQAVATAQREVRGVLGDVYGMDSAGAIYREALKHVGVDVAQLPKGTESTAWQAYKVAAGAAAGVRPASEHAMDSKAIESAQSGILGHLSRISVKG